jgi:hypothetical protein
MSCVRIPLRLTLHMGISFYIYLYILIYVASLIKDVDFCALWPNRCWINRSLPSVTRDAEDAKEVN